MVGAEHWFVLMFAAAGIALGASKRTALLGVWLGWNVTGDGRSR